MKRYLKSLFIFRRDLRIEDNTALNAAYALSDEVHVCFIFDPIAVGEDNPYRSLNAIQFMLASIDELERTIRANGGVLNLFYGNTSAIVNKILTYTAFDAVFVNRDYTPYSIVRDMEINALCNRHATQFNTYDDLLLTTPELILTSSGTPYKRFTDFYNKACRLQIPTPSTKKPRLLSSAPLPHSSTLKTIEHNHTWAQYTNEHIFKKGGRREALNIIKKLSSFTHYTTTRDFPALETTGLSAHHKFGTVSIREVYHSIVRILGPDSLLLKQLYWRDFFTHLAFHYPHVFNGAFNPAYDHLTWNTDEQSFAAWCNGMTGFPIVDAGMHQLNWTGFMHNRVRMIVASFLIKDMHISWELGERYFAQQLVDYDPCVNNGNWQWCASTGADSQPYFRIFNPWLQQKKFDPDCTYIKRWIPELRAVPIKTIHTWHKQTTPLTSYPLAILDHSTEARMSMSYYRSAQHAAKIT